MERNGAIATGELALDGGYKEFLNSHVNFSWEGIGDNPASNARFDSDFSGPGRAVCSMELMFGAENSMRSAGDAG